MLPFPCWERLPAAPPPAPPLDLQIAALQAAVSQESWGAGAFWVQLAGVFVQLLAFIAAGVAVFLTHKTAAQAVRQADLAQQQLSAQQSKDDAESLIAASELLTFVRDVFTDVHLYPTDSSVDELAGWGEEQHARALRANPAQRHLDDVAVAGIRLCARIRAAGCTAAWQATIDALRAVERNARRVANRHASESFDQLETMLRQSVGSLQFEVGRLFYLLEHASRVSPPAAVSASPAAPGVAKWKFWRRGSGGERTGESAPQHPG